MVVLKVFVSIIVAVAFGVCAEQIKVDHFNARVFCKDDMEQLSQRDPYLTVAVKILQDSWRAHLDEVRLEDASYIIKDTRYKYFLTLYDVIPNILARVIFNINVKGEGTKYRDIITCAGDAKNYTISEMNYLLLINSINEVKNGSMTIDNNLIQNVANKISDNIELNKETLNSSVYNIKQYEKQLKLLEYFGRIRNFVYTLRHDKDKLEDYIANKDQLPELRKEMICAMTHLFNLITITSPKSSSKQTHPKFNLFVDEDKNTALYKRMTSFMHKYDTNIYKQYELDDNNEIHTTSLNSHIIKFDDDECDGYKLTNDIAANWHAPFAISEAYIYNYKIDGHEIAEVALLYAIHKMTINEQDVYDLLNLAQRTHLSNCQQNYIDIWKIKKQIDALHNGLDFLYFYDKPGTRELQKSITKLSQAIINIRDVNKETNMLDIAHQSIEKTINACIKSTK